MGVHAFAGVISWAVCARALEDAFMLHSGICQ